MPTRGKTRTAGTSRAASGGGAPPAISPDVLAGQAEDILASILSVSTEGIVVTDAELNIVVFSRGAEIIFGHAARDVVGRSVEILIPEAFHAAHRRQVAAFARNPAPSRRMDGSSEVLGRTLRGDLIPLEVGLSKRATAHGHLYTALVRDISERRLTEAALAKAAADANAASLAKSSFLAAMSHEIRTPLNGVLGMAQAMARDELPPKQRERLEVVRESGEALLAILNDLLDLSKIEAGRMVLEDVEFGLEDVARAVHRTFGALAAQKGLAFTLHIEPRARGRYHGDPLRLRQLLNNLVSNAIKFTDKGSVDVRVSRRGRCLKLDVRDTGVGIPAERIARLFEKFEQGDVSTTRRWGGTGLGLAICRSLCDMMGGAIVVESEAGQGARFTVTLPIPRAASQAEVEAEAPARQGEPITPALRVLVAEDNAINQLVVRTLLNQLGVDPLVVPDGQAAIDAWAAQPCDLILMDVQMPGIDGPTAASIIRAREQAERRPRTPILALTANAMAHQAEDYRNAGMDGVIAKPIVVEDLLRALSNLPDTSTPDRPAAAPTAAAALSRART